MPAATPMPGTIHRENVLVGGGQLWLAPVGSSFPADDVTITTPFVYSGATQEGVTQSFTQNTNDINVDEQATPVNTPVQTTDLNYATVLSEDTLETMKLAFGGGTIAVVAASTGVMGKRTLTLASKLDQLALIFEGIGPAGFYRRVQVPIVSSTANAQVAYRRAADARRYAVTFRALVDPSNIAIIEKTANAL
jgi:hypothetical protein